jgi:hypothetical protein
MDKRYGVYKVFIEEDSIDKWFWGEWTDANKANEVALKLRNDGFITEVIEFEQAEPLPKHISFKRGGSL